VLQKKRLLIVGVLTLSKSAAVRETLVAYSVT
jgi:hypothetical protein